MEHKKFRSKTHPCIRSHFCSEKSHPLKYFSTGNWFSQSMGQGISHKRRQWWPIAEVKITHYYLFFWPSQWVSIKWFNTLHREKKVVISGIYLSTRAERERPKWGYFGGGWQMISSQDSWGAKWVLRKPWSKTASKICKHKVPVWTSRVYQVLRSQRQCSRNTNQ